MDLTTRQGRDHLAEPRLRRRRRLARAAAPSSRTSTSTTAPSRGWRTTRQPLFTVQYHPEASPGPHDAQLPVPPLRRHDGRARWLTMPKRTDLTLILLIGSGPIVIGQACEFDYSGTQACKALQGGGLPGHPGQLEPGDDHDRPRVRRPHVHRAAHRRGARAHHRGASGPTRCCRRSAARPALNLAHRARRARHARALRRRADRRQARRDQEGRGPRPLQGGDASASASTCRAAAIAHTLEEAEARRGRDRPAAHHPAVAHARRHRRRHRRPPTRSSTRTSRCGPRRRRRPARC